TSTLVVRLYDGPLMAVSHARSAQVHFAAARSAAPADKAVIDDAMKELVADIEVVRDRMPVEDRAAIDKALTMAQAWQKGGAGAPKAADVDDALDVMAEGASAYGFNFRAAAEADAKFARMAFLIMVIMAVLIGAGSAAATAYSISRPVNATTKVMRLLASGDYSVEIPGAGRKDEIGGMGQSLAAVKDSPVEGGRAAGARREQPRQAQAERQRMMTEIADQFQATIGAIVNHVSSASSE